MTFSKHALEQMELRNLSKSNVIGTVIGGNIIREEDNIKVYDYDGLRVVLADDDIVVTAYFDWEPKKRFQRWREMPFDVGTKKGRSRMRAHQ